MGYWTWEGVTIRKCGGYGVLLDVGGGNDKEVWGIVAARKKCGGYGGILDVGGSNDKEVWGIWWDTGRGRE